MEKGNLVILASVVSFVVGTVIGTGGYWKYQELKISKSGASVVLRTELSRLMDDVITTTAEFEKLDLCGGGTPDARNRARELHVRLDLYQDDFESIEGKLADLEGREPRLIDLEFSPPCPPENLEIR